MARTQREMILSAGTSWPPCMTRRATRSILICGSSVPIKNSWTKYPACLARTRISNLLGCDMTVSKLKLRFASIQSLRRRSAMFCASAAFAASGPSSADAISSGLIYSPKSKSRLRSHRVSVVFPDPSGPATIKTNGWFKTRRSEPITPPICAALSWQGTRLPGRATVLPHRNLRSGHWENSEPVRPS